MLCGIGRSLAWEDSLSLCSTEWEAVCIMVPCLGLAWDAAIAQKPSKTRRTYRMIVVLVSDGQCLLTDSSLKVPHSAEEYVEL